MQVKKIRKSASSASVELQVSMDRRKSTDIAKRRSESTEMLGIDLFNNLLANVVELPDKSQSR